MGIKHRGKTRVRGGGRPAIKRAPRDNRTAVLLETCPTCQQGGGDPCIKTRAGGAAGYERRGKPLDDPHPARVALAGKSC